MAVHAETGGGVALRVEVYEEYAATLPREVRAEIDGGGGFADAAFLVDEGVDFAHWWVDYI